MRSLITGIGGFAGSHLAELLVSRGETVHGTVKDPSDTGLIGHLLDRKQIEVHAIDIRESRAMVDLLAQERYDRIYHLAGITFILDSVASPEETLDVNLGGTRALFEAARLSAPGARILCVSSAAAYGDLDDPGLPVEESTPFRPNNPYGFSKAAGDLLAYQYVSQHGLHIVRARPFNHTGPRQAPVFVCSEFAKAVAEIEAGRRTGELKVGNLEVGRDFSDVRDIVRGYALLLEKGAAGSAYNLSSGKSVKIGEILETLAGMARAEIRIRQDPGKLRPGEVLSIAGSSGKALRETGWRPNIPFEQTLRDLLDWWRARV
ncbi:MAG: GDP-mannose 4,6-dehydratase [Deltaproteobacteria bacterium]|nr:GDP-mannose 4,6-dehydratase [Deltaproteobacteria bacterium]